MTKAHVLGWTKSAFALAAGVLRIFAGHGWRACVMCRHRIPAFMPWRGGKAAAPALLSALHMIGSDLDHFACPLCGCNDRERHLRLYIERSDLADFVEGKRVLHFAPEKRLAPWIASLKPAEHVLADLYPQDNQVRRIDLENIPYPDSYFDMVIANHVLEHVANLDLAVAEISRVLVDGGLAILQVPWCQGLSKSIEDPGVVSHEARLQLYGQEDHVRLFGSDVFERIGRSGLVSEPHQHSELLSDVDPLRAGVNPEEPFMKFRRSDRMM